MSNAFAKPLSAVLCLSLAGGLVLNSSLPALAGGSSSTASSSSSSGSGRHEAGQAGATSVKLENLDKEVSPCSDFFEYANGSWLKKTEIPADRPNWGVLNIINDNNLKLLRQLLEKAEETRAKAGTNEKKLGDFYFAGMNEKKIDEEGMKPLADELKKIDQIDSLESLRKEVSRLHQFGVGVFFNFSSGQDFKDSTKVIAQAEQGGLGLPDRDYYIEEDEGSKKIREQYIDHMTKMFALMSEDKEQSGKDAQTIMKIETALARASMKKAEMRNPEAVYHKMQLKEVEGLTPHFSWKGYVDEVGDPSISIAVVNIGQPDFFKAMDRELESVPLSDWRTYLKWHLLNDTAPYLSSKFVDEDFDFNGRILKGSRALLPRWKRVVEATNNSIGMALGELYVQAVFPPEAKTRALSLVKRLKEQLRGDLTTLSWMGPETRKQALKKLNAFGEKIGYPDKWRDYSKLEIDRQSYLWNVLRAQQFEFKRLLAKIGKPVDRSEWLMNPQTVNAYYWSEMNEIVFPAGILQPPIFDPKADDATNLGAMGMVIGHEMTHGFDDQGRKFDAQGNMKNWWTADDLKRFEERVSLIEKQYGGYTVAGGVHFKGKLVEGEAAADLGGLTIAYKTLEAALKDKIHVKDESGFTPAQRFFLSFAQAWATKYRPEMERLMANTNPHPTAHYRVDGTLANMDQFAEAFSCKGECKMMLPEKERCRLW